MKRDRVTRLVGDPHRGIQLADPPHGFRGSMRGPADPQLTRVL